MPIDCEQDTLEACDCMCVGGGLAISFGRVCWVNCVELHAHATMYEGVRGGWYATRTRTRSP